MLTKIKSSISKAKNWAEDQREKFPRRGGHVRALTMCSKCYTFYYKNSWHFEKPEYLASDSETEVPIRFTQCPACIEQELAFYDSEQFA